MIKKLCTFIFMAILASPVIGDDMSPLSVVNKRMDSYNKHDLESIMSTYSDEVEIYTYPSKLLTQGKNDLESIFKFLFKGKVVHVTVHHQITKDSYVINHETVKYSDKTIDYVSVYKVVNGLIEEVRFVRD